METIPTSIDQFRAESEARRKAQNDDLQCIFQANQEKSRPAMWEGHKEPIHDWFGMKWTLLLLGHLTILLAIVIVSCGLIHFTRLFLSMIGM